MKFSMFVFAIARRRKFVTSQFVTSDYFVTYSQIVTISFNIGIDIPKLGFSENACMTKKFSLEIEELVSVIFKQYFENTKFYFSPKKIRFSCHLIVTNL